ncbi:helix-turn-helix transcriptional regulator [Ruminococcus sp.]|uniref:helix-turn-helix domain-containing protein n=1 Tax=Ruminococcus sp. TaxID=41978 RepID=UPI0025D8B198|nr:helix-turn-helix transcriptional regulator [Ruminococcus sp.]MBQ8967274.1 helix-turn-helix transcriptional regulator [Ruminococcus sp.]
MRYNYMLKKLRTEKTLTQEDLADVLHISRAAYCRYENESREIPIALLIQLADIYSTSTDYILGRTKIKTPYPFK